MNDKFILTGTDNDGFRHRYSIKKNEAFKKAFLKFMIALDFDSKIIKHTFLGEDKNENPIILKISEFEDCIRHYQNSKFDVDVFYGNKEIVVLVRTKERDIVVKHLEKKAGWIKILKVKKIKRKKKVIIPLQKVRT